jgi:hypothetical protein
MMPYHPTILSPTGFPELAPGIASAATLNAFVELVVRVPHARSGLRLRRTDRALLARFGLSHHRHRRGKEWEMFGIELVKVAMRLQRASSGCGAAALTSFSRRRTILPRTNGLPCCVESPSRNRLAREPSARRPVDRHRRLARISAGFLVQSMGVDGVLSEATSSKLSGNHYCDAGNSVFPSLPTCSKMPRELCSGRTPRNV